MATDGRAWLAILGMAIVTYATRAGGFWLMARVPASPRLEAWLRHVPGAVLAAIGAPAALAAGPAGIAAAVVAMLVMRRTGSLPAAMAVGVGVVLLLRSAA